MKTMTINLTDNEFEIIEELCKKRGITKTGLVRQSIRMYQTLIDKVDDGRIIMDNGLRKKELLIIP